MINLFTALKGLLSLANYIAKYLNDKQLLDAGEYKAIARNNEEALNTIRAAQEAQSAVSDDGAFRKRVRDKYRDPE